MDAYVFALLCMPVFSALIVSARILDSKVSIVAKLALIVALSPTAFAATYYALMFSGYFYMVLTD